MRYNSILLAISAAFSTAFYPVFAQGDGQATWYNTGVGACGYNNNDADYIAAVSDAVWYNQNGASQSYSPVCGKSIQINHQDRAVHVVVVDRCPGCSGNDLDLSPAAFSALADQSEGRIGIWWQFT